MDAEISREQSEECGRCRYWRLTKIENRHEEFGTCHWQPPFGCRGAIDKTPKRLRWYFPLTRGDDWCGGYQAREPAA